MSRFARVFSLLAFQCSLGALLADGQADAETCSAELAVEGGCTSSSSAPWIDALRREAGDAALWGNNNACMVDALRSSVPLTAAYALDMVWPQVVQHRQAAGRSSAPLEIHILGAAYPFEGRSDWRHLARHVAPHVPGIRVVLVLGEPLHADNVPEVEGKPIVGPANHEHEACGMNELFEKERQADYEFSLHACGKFGEQVEVDCIEMLYQDYKSGEQAEGPLRAPDVVLFFSPGFGHTSRRSWDAVLLDLLEDSTPFVVGDEAVVSLEPILDGRTTFGPEGAQPGYVVAKEETPATLSSYRAQCLGQRRSLFPLTSLQGSSLLAKNAVFQAYQGYQAGAEPQIRPTKDSSPEREELLEFIRVRHMAEENEKDMLNSFSTHVSLAYDRVMFQLLQGTIAELAETGMRDLEATTPAKQKRAIASLEACSYSAGYPDILRLFKDILDAGLWGEAEDTLL